MHSKSTHPFLQGLSGFIEWSHGTFPQKVEQVVHFWNIVREHA